MSESITINSYIIAEVELGQNGVYATGSPEFPILVVNLRMLFRGFFPNKTTLDFREIRCRVSPFDKSYTAISLPRSLNIRAKTDEEIKDDWQHIEIP